jgi:hypothetical protein
MHSLGGVFGDLFLQRGASRTISAGRRFTNGEALIDTQKELSAGPTHPNEEEPATTETIRQHPATPDQERVLRIFSVKGDKLELSDNRLKASTRADYLRRLTYLFLYAHELHGRGSVPEADLKSLLRTAKMIDRAGNDIRWLNKHIGFASEGEDHVKLNAKGREEAKKALGEALDSKLPDPWNPDVYQPKKRGPRKKKKP